MPPRQSPRKASDIRLMPGRNNDLNGTHVEDSLVNDEDTIPELYKSKKRSGGASEFIKLSMKAQVTNTESRDKDQSPPSVVASLTTKAKRGKGVVSKATPKKSIALKEEPANAHDLTGKQSTVKVSKVEIVEEESQAEETPIAQPKRARKVVAKAVQVAKGEEQVNFEESPQKRKRAKKVEATVLANKEGADEPEGGQPSPKKKRPRKTKEEKELEAMPLATRTQGLRMYIGAHVSGAKGLSAHTLLPRHRIYTCKDHVTDIITQNRSAKYGHKCCSYWVCKHKTENSLPLLMCSGQILLLVSSNLNASGKILRYKMIIEINFTPFVQSTSTNLQSMWDYMLSVNNAKLIGRPSDTSFLMGHIS